MREKLIEIGEDLMDTVGGTFPPDEHPPLGEIFQEIEKDGQPYGGDAMFSVCVINAKRIDELLKICPDSVAIHGSLATGYDVDCTHISNCCDADLWIGGGTTQHYVCTKCGYPCDVKQLNGGVVSND